MLEDLPIIIQGEHIHLAKPEVSFDFAKKMFAVVDVNREHILPWLEWATFERTKSAEDEFAFALDADNSWRDGSRFEFAIYSNDTKDYLGGISLIKRGKTVCKCFEIGYWLRKDYCKKGYMQEAVMLLEKTAFNHDVERIIIRNDTSNIASKNVAIKCGYQLEGVARHSQYNSVLQEFRDLNIFSKLKSEYKK
jgi:RimJ/RimL family protein N-acetyltransferase